MRCNKCRNEAVFFQAYSGRHLCNRHLVADIEARVKRSIRSHRWMRPGDHIAVVVSGDRRSAALLSFLKKLTADRRDIRLSAVPVDGNDAGTGGTSFAAKVIALHGIPIIQMPLTGTSGIEYSNVTKIALAITLDDVAQVVLGQFLFGNAGRIVYSPPSLWGTIPVICPFIAIPSDELDLYGKNKETGIEPVGGTLRRDTRPREVESLLEDYARRHPATKFALLHLAEQLSGGDAFSTLIADAAGPLTDENHTSLQ